MRVVCSKETKTSGKSNKKPVDDVRKTADNQFMVSNAFVSEIQRRSQRLRRPKRIDADKRPPHGFPLFRIFDLIF